MGKPSKEVLESRAYFLARCSRCSYMWVSRGVPSRYEGSVKCPSCRYVAYKSMPTVQYSKADPLPKGKWGERIEKCDTSIRLVILYRSMDGKLYRAFDVPNSVAYDIGICGNAELRDMCFGYTRMRSLVQFQMIHRRITILNL